MSTTNLFQLGVLEVLERFKAGSCTPAAYLAELRNRSRVLEPEIRAEAPSGLSDTGDAAFCTPWTFLGLPAITLPAGFGPAGLPLGIQLTGPNREDFKLARIACWCERVTGYERSWPFN